MTMKKIINVVLALVLVLLFSTPALSAGFFFGTANKFKTYEKAADTIVLTATECSDSLITNKGWDGADDQTFTLPAASAGLKFKFLAVIASGGTADTYFDTEGATTNIYLDGTAVGDGQRVWTQQPAIGESIIFHTFTIDGTNYEWAADSCNGVWEDKGS